MEFLKIWNIVIRRKWVILLSFVLAYVCIILVGNVITKQYKAKARILVETTDTLTSFMTGLGLQKAPSTSTPDDDYDTNIAMATIRPLLEQVIQALQLKDGDGSALDPEDLVKWSLVHKLYKPRPYMKVDQYEDSTRMLEITGTSRDPKLAADMCNTLADLFIKDRIRKTENEYKSARIFIEGEIQKVQQQYYKDLADTMELMKKEGFVNLDVENQKLNELRSQLNELRLSLVVKSVDVSKEHPDYKAIAEEIETVNKSIDAELAKTPAHLAEKAKLDASTSVDKTLYQQLRTYLIEVGVAESVTLSKIRLESPAVPPTKIHFPKPIHVYVLGFLLSVFWGFFMGFFVEYIDETARTPRDLRAIKQLPPLLGTVPESGRLGNNATISGLERTSPLVEAYRSIRNNLQDGFAGAAGTKLGVIVVTSSIPGEGTTSVVSNLALAFKEAGRKVVVVDLNLRKPAVHKFLRVDAAKGVADVLADPAALERTIIRDADGLDVLPAGDVPANPAGAIESAGLKELVAKLRAKYDVVMLDTPPVTCVDDPIIVGKQADIVLMVVAASMPTVAVVEQARQALDNGHIGRVALVFNRIDMQMSDYRRNPC
jgi:capsular exopolysaccharide synthesis family protein